MRAYVIGDSLALGAGASDAAASFASVMCSRFNWSCTIDGKGGSGYIAKGNGSKEDQSIDESFPARLDAIVAASPSVVVVSGGSNDMYAEPADVEAAAADFLSNVRNRLPDADIVVLGGFAWDTEAERHKLPRQAVTATALESAAQSVDALFIDPVGLVNISSSNAATTLSADGFHPTAAGYRSIAGALVSVLRDAKFPMGPEIWRQEAAFSNEWEDLVEISVTSARP